VDGRSVDFGPESDEVVGVLSAYNLSSLQIDTVNAGRCRERVKSEERFIAVPATAVSKYRADRRKGNVGDFLSLEIKELQLRRRILLVLREELSSIDGDVLQDRIRLWNDLPPRAAIKVAGLGDEHAIARGILIGCDVDLAFADLGAVVEILPRRQTRRGIVPVRVHQEKFGLRPSLRDVNE